MTKKAAPRRNRVPHINSSTVRGRVKQFRPSEEDWRRIEKAYSQSINANGRSEIVEIVDRYFHWAPFEEHALRAKDVKRPIKRVEKATATLLEALHTLFKADRVDGRANEHARLLIEGILSTDADPAVLSEAGLAMDQDNLEQAARLLMDERKSRFRNNVNVEELLPNLAQLQDVCQLAGDYLTEVIDGRSGFDIGNSWAEMICELQAWAKETGKPITISTNREQKKPSAFVQFVLALQVCFPANFQRHTHSGEASLADAMSKAVLLTRD